MVDTETEEGPDIKAIETGRRTQCIAEGKEWLLLTAGCRLGHDLLSLEIVEWISDQ
jgi:hypothetical protein